MSDKNETIVLGGGCFWCLDATFSHVRGVESVVAGYAGGDYLDPSYEEVSTGKTGHAEVVLITFNSLVIDLRKILEIFFYTHDPTTINRQGNDVGSQYRSILLYKNDNERIVSETVIKELTNRKVYDKPIVTELKLLDKFYRAEEEHQKYFDKNPEKAYCQIVIAPKLRKFREVFEKYYQ